MHRKKGCRRPTLTTGEKLTIIHAAIVLQLPWKEITKEHRVSMATVGMLVGKAKKNPKFISEIHNKRDAWIAKENAIRNVVDQMIQEDVFVDNCRAVIARVSEQDGPQCTEREVRLVMKAMGMTYRKVKHIPIGANSNRNLILRQRFVMAALAKDNKQRVYLNVDETWIGMSDFRRMKW